MTEDAKSVRLKFCEGHEMKIAKIDGRFFGEEAVHIRRNNQHLREQMRILAEVG